MSTLEVGKIVPATGTAITLGDSGDTFTIPASATLDVNGTIDVAGATLTGSFGKVLQVVQTVKTDTTSTTAVTTSLVDITGMTVDITPSATTSKVLVFWSTQVGTVANSGVNIRLVRDSATPLLGDAASSRIRVTTLASPAHTEVMGVGNGVYLDSPSSTSSVTYKLQWSKNSAGTTYLNRSNVDTDSASYARSTSSITVMEIGA